MSRQKLAIVLATVTTFIALGTGLAADARPSQKYSSRRTTSHLVPPPPAYMPAILPELEAQRKKAVKKPKNPIKRYVYNREGYEDPVPVKTNKYTTYWNPAANSPVLEKKQTALPAAPTNQL